MKKIKRVLTAQGDQLRIPVNDGYMDLTLEQVKAIVCNIHPIVKFLFIEQQREEAQEELEALE